MEEIICAMAGMALGGGLMALGYALGRVEWGLDWGSGEESEPAQRGAAQGEAAPREEPDPGAGPREKAIERLEADQRAFSALMGYSADVAYGLTKQALTEE